MKKQREVEFDILRVFATIAVIATHVCGSEIHDLAVTDSNFVWLNCIRAAITWDVPVFVLISGRFFLDSEKNISVEMLYQKYIKHLIIAFGIWSAIYTSYYIAYDIIEGKNVVEYWKGYVYQFLIGPYHMWYLFMIVGLYIVTPILRKIVEDKRLTEYFVILFIFFQYMQQYAVKTPIIGDVLSEMFGKTYFHIALGYAGYFVLGYYLYKYGISEKYEKILYLLTIILIIFSCVGTTMDSVASGELNEFLSTYQTPNVIIESCGIYVFFLKRVSKIKISEKTKKVFEILGKWGLGIYLSHALVLEFVGILGMKPTFITPIIGVTVMTVIVLLLCVILVWLMQKIPLVKKYMM